MTVDLHSHILPGLDDGARDEAMALEMLRVAANDGTKTIVATPHAGRADRDQILSGVEALNTVARAHALDIAVLPGSEIQASADIMASFTAGSVVTINQTPYTLVEMPLAGSWPRYATQVLFDLGIVGSWPILAHAERYPAVQRHPQLIADLVNDGIVVQINASSLTGLAGRDARQTAELLLRARLAHVIASDAHDLRVRPPRISEAIERARHIVGSDYAALMVAIAEKIVRGEPVQLPEPESPGSSSLLDRFTSRVFGRVM